jgi:DNA-binding NarL/FixJ family response regulator
MSLESLTFLNTEMPESLLTYARSLPEAFAPPKFETSESSAQKPEQTTLAGEPTELATLQSKAIRSIELCQQTIADFFVALANADQRFHHCAGLATRRVSFVEAHAVSFEALFNSAKNLVFSVSDPDQPTIPLLSKTKADNLPDSDRKARLDQLTEREKCVFQLLVQGLPNKMIAFELGIAETTVKAHVGAILRKLGVYSRARAIVLVTKLKA